MVCQDFRCIKPCDRTDKFFNQGRIRQVLFFKTRQPGPASPSGRSHKDPIPAGRLTAGEKFPDGHHPGQTDPGKIPGPRKCSRPPEPPHRFQAPADAGIHRFHIRIRHVRGNRQIDKQPHRPGIGCGKITECDSHRFFTDLVPCLPAPPEMHILMLVSVVTTGRAMVFKRAASSPGPTFSTDAVKFFGSTGVAVNFSINPNSLSQADLSVRGGQPQALANFRACSRGSGAREIQVITDTPAAPRKNKMRPGKHQCRRWPPPALTTHPPLAARP